MLKLKIKRQYNIVKQRLRVADSCNTNSHVFENEKDNKVFELTFE